MSRQKRLKLPGTYYVLQQAAAQRWIFSGPDDYDLLEKRLRNVVRRTSAKVQGYCWTVEALRLVVRVGEVTIGEFMGQLSSEYSRAVHRRSGASGQFFPRPYGAILIEPQAYLLGLLQYLHYVPVMKRLVREPAHYPYSSDAAYRAGLHIPWLDKRAVERLLQGRDKAAAYRALMSSPPAAALVDFIEAQRAGVPRILGSPASAKGLAQETRRMASRSHLDEIVSVVVKGLGVSIEEIRSDSRVRQVVLARALIARHATVRHVMTLRAVAGYLQRDPGGLSRTIRVQARLRPALFRPDGLRQLGGLVPLAGGPGERQEDENRDES